MSISAISAKKRIFRLNRAFTAAILARREAKCNDDHDRSDNGRSAASSGARISELPDPTAALHFSRTWEEVLPQDAGACDNRTSFLIAMNPVDSAPIIAQEPGITPEVLRDHGISPEEYDRILKALGREPTFTELGIFSVMWSEHCSYKSSRVHLKRLPTHSRRVVQGPGENAGIIDIGDGWACAFKIESHNHPSFIEPFQGAATGVGGILRDIFTMGARPVAVMDSLRFGPIQTAAELRSAGQPGAAVPTQALSTQAELRKNHSVMEGVVSGIASYGNCFGVP